jgi:hypothetical protein
VYDENETGRKCDVCLENMEKKVEKGEEEVKGMAWTYDGGFRIGMRGPSIVRTQRLGRGKK